MEAQRKSKYCSYLLLVHFSVIIYSLPGAENSVWDPSNNCELKELFSQILKVSFLCLCFYLLVHSVGMEWNHALCSNNSNIWSVSPVQNTTVPL